MTPFTHRAPSAFLPFAISSSTSFPRPPSQASTTEQPPPLHHLNLDDLNSQLGKPDKPCSSRRVAAPPSPGSPKTLVVHEHLPSTGLNQGPFRERSRRRLRGLSEIQIRLSTRLRTLPGPTRRQGRLERRLEKAKAKESKSEATLTRASN